MNWRLRFSGTASWPIASVTAESRARSRAGRARAEILRDSAGGMSWTPKKRQ
jgi:hypothetical protein